MPHYETVRAAASVASNVSLLWSVCPSWRVFRGDRLMSIVKYIILILIWYSMYFT